MSIRKLKCRLIESLCKKELDAYKQNFENKILRFQKEAQEKCDNEIKEKTAILNTVRAALKDKVDIIAEADNKMGEHVIVTKHIGKKGIFGADIVFSLYSNRYKACNNHPRIMATYKAPHVSLDTNAETYIHIDDILVIDNNYGNGSILMPYFIEYCKSTDASFVSGALSSVDKDHFARSIHFYEKHGFTVTMNENGESGSISLSLH